MAGCGSIYIGGTVTSLTDGEIGDVLLSIAYMEEGVGHFD